MRVGHPDHPLVLSPELFCGYEFIEKLTFAASAGPQTISGLNGDADQYYLLQVRVRMHGTTSDQKPLYMRPNNDSTANIYTTTHFWMARNSAGSCYSGVGCFYGGNGIALASTVWNNEGFWIGNYYINAQTGFYRSLSALVFSYGITNTNNQGMTVNGIWRDSATNITSLTFLCVDASLVCTGTLCLYRGITPPM